MTAPAQLHPGPEAPGREPGGPLPQPHRPLRAGYASEVPQVDLLPPEIVDARRFRLLQRQLAAAVVAVALLCGLGAVWAEAGVASARNDLATVQAGTTGLRREQARYAGVPAALADLDRVKLARQAALGSDVAWYRFLSDLAVNTPAGAELTSVSVTMSGGTTGSTQLPLIPAGLGQVDVSGKAARFEDVAVWLEAVDAVHGLAGSGLSRATRQTQDGSDPGTSGSSAGVEAPVSFTGSAVVVPASLSHRYDRKAD